jgi:acyl-coenzyme A thioesterase PaaI-like protein
MAEAPARAAALFSPADGGGSAFVAAPMTRGPWDEAMMHGGAPAALLARAVEATEPGASLMVTRLTIELLGGVPLGPVSVETSLAKPGRRFQIVEATLDADGRRACLARAVRVRRADIADAAAAPAGFGAARLPGPQTGEALPTFVRPERGMFYPDATEIRQVGGELGSGHVVAWIRLRGDLLPGEAPSPLVRTAAAADFANGLSWILPFDEWLFVNTELTIHLYRDPAGEWIGLDASTVSDASGIGLATAVLHDLRGPFGVCAQSLFVERR